MEEHRLFGTQGHATDFLITALMGQQVEQNPKDVQEVMKIFARAQYQGVRLSKNSYLSPLLIFGADHTTAVKKAVEVLSEYARYHNTTSEVLLIAFGPTLNKALAISSPETAVEMLDIFAKKVRRDNLDEMLLKAKLVNRLNFNCPSSFILIFHIHI